MTVHRKAYRPYVGDLKPFDRLFAVIARREIRLALRKKWVRRLFIMAAIPLVASSVMLYVRVVVEQALRMPLLTGSIFENLFKPQIFFLVLMMAAAGSDLVAKDVRTSAHHLYFARPLSVWQYVLGKILAPFALFAALLMLPGLLLALVQLLLAPSADYSAFARKVVEVSVYGLVLSAAAAGLIALLSSYGRRSRYVGLAWMVLYFFSDIVSQALQHALDLDWARLLSFRVLFLDSGRFLYIDRDPPDGLALLVLLALGTLSVCLFYLRVAALERQEK